MNTLSLHYAAAVLAGIVSRGAQAQVLTPAELESVESFFGLDDAQRGVIDIGGYRRDDEAYGYVALQWPNDVQERLRLCSVEHRWIQGVVGKEGIKWAPELFQVTFDVWEANGGSCEVKHASEIPEHIRVMNEIDGAALLRIIEAQKALRDLALQSLSKAERKRHRRARLVELEVDGFAYHAMFRSDGYGGIWVAFSEAPTGFVIYNAGIYLY